jgi:hypothetical protein
MKKWWFLGIAVMLSPYLVIVFRTNMDFKHRILTAARGADRVVITPTDMVTCSAPDTPSTELQGEEQVLDLLNQIEVVPPEKVWGGLGEKGFRCMCDGDFHLDAYRGDTLLVSIGYQHGENIRWRNDRSSGSDRKLTGTSRSAVPAWLEAHGYPAMKQWYERGCKKP